MVYNEIEQGIQYSATTLRVADNQNVIGMEWAGERKLSNPTAIDPILAIESMSKSLNCQGLTQILLEDAFGDVDYVIIGFVAQNVGDETQFVITTINDDDVHRRVLILSLDGTIKITSINPSQEEIELLLCNNKFLLSKL